jgi:D-arabinose 1-dehydrogenase-like Zn-dependent alcohol dehydrogenase
MDERQKIWRKLTGEWKPDHLDSIMSECSLDDLNEKIELILQGKVRGRVVVDLSG